MVDVNPTKENPNQLYYERVWRFNQKPNLEF